MSAEKPTLLKFTAPWCEPCHRLTKALQETDESKYFNIKVVDVTTKEGQAKAETYHARSLPTVVCLDRSGSVCHSWYGFHEAKLVHELRTALSRSR